MRQVEVMSWAEATENRKIVGMVEFRGRLLVATADAIYEVDDHVLTEMGFVKDEAGDAD